MCEYFVSICIPKKFSFFLSDSQGALHFTGEAQHKFYCELLFSCHKKRFYFICRQFIVVSHLLLFLPIAYKFIAYRSFCCVLLLESFSLGFPTSFDTKKEIKYIDFKVSFDRCDDRTLSVNRSIISACLQVVNEKKGRKSKKKFM